MADLGRLVKKHVATVISPTKLIRREKLQILFTELEDEYNDTLSWLKRARQFPVGILYTFCLAYVRKVAIAYQKMAFGNLTNIDGVRIFYLLVLNCAPELEHT